MIGKITHGDDLYGLLRYNFKKIEEGVAGVLNKSNVDSTESISDIMDSFESRLIANKRNQSPIFHVSLNPDPDDIITDEQMKQIADEYMEKMGFKDQPYVVFKHFDVDREHIHIVSTYVQENGVSISRFNDRIKNKKICREIENKYSIRVATEQQWREAKKINPVDYTSLDKEKQMREVIQEVKSRYYYNSFGEFNAILSRYNIKAEQISRGDRKTLTYSIINKVGRNVIAPIPANRIGANCTLSKIENSYKERSKDKNKEIIKELNNKIFNALIESRSLQTFQKNLAKQNINVDLIKNKDGRIYSCVFADHYRMTAYKASRINKLFSAKLFDALDKGEVVNINKHNLEWKALEDFHSISDDTESTIVQSKEGCQDPGNTQSENTKIERHKAENNSTIDDEQAEDIILKWAKQDYHSEDIHSPLDQVEIEDMEESVILDTFEDLVNNNIDDTLTAVYLGYRKRKKHKLK